MLSRASCVTLLLFASAAQSASLLQRSYEYFVGLGNSVAPGVGSVFDCLRDEDAWTCAKARAALTLDSWDVEVDKQRRIWQDAADAEARSSGRSLSEMPSRLGREVEQSLYALADIIQSGVARAFGRNPARKEDRKAISTTNNDKKMIKLKPRPPKIHLMHPVATPAKKLEEGRAFHQGKVQSWVIGHKDVGDDIELSNAPFTYYTDDAKRAFGVQEFGIEETDADDSEIEDEAIKEWNDSRTGVGNFRRGRGLVSEVWGIGEKALDALAEHVVENENAEDGVQEKSSIEEQRGKKKKKKKAILKLLILGAVLKAKIGTLLQILSFKLQVKFFIIALIGLAINLARFWVELKNKHQQPQKVIYYEHAQHQHHYEHEDEPGWGPWSRSIDPEEVDVDADVAPSPYRAQDRLATARPLLTLS